MVAGQEGATVPYPSFHHKVNLEKCKQYLFCVLMHCLFVTEMFKMYCYTVSTITKLLLLQPRRCYWKCLMEEPFRCCQTKHFWGFPERSYPPGSSPENYKPSRAFFCLHSLRQYKHCSDVSWQLIYQCPFCVRHYFCNNNRHGVGMFCVRVHLSVGFAPLHKQKG